MRARIFTTLGFAALALALADCAGSEPRQASLPVSAMGPAPLPSTQTDGAAEHLVVGATSCWMGGLWSDALGEQDNPPNNATGVSNARTAGIERRCDEVLQDVYGTVDLMQYRRLRAIEPQVVDALAMRVRSVADNDRADRGHAEQLVLLVRAVADAQRENVLARGPADDVKRDEEHGVGSSNERASDETYAAAFLRRTTGIEALLSLDAGDLSPEAHAIGTLCALDRLEIARRLPEHLKLYAVGGPFAVLFGVQAPQVRPDPATPVPSGTWPRYLATVAGVTGHAVPAAATRPIDRESLAWGGVLQGFADRFHAEMHALSRRTSLPLVVSRVAERLDNESSTLKSLFETEQRGK
jgi:hypothetical protein